MGLSSHADRVVGVHCVKLDSATALGLLCGERRNAGWLCHHLLMTLHQEQEPDRDAQDGMVGVEHRARDWP